MEVIMLPKINHQLTTLEIPSSKNKIQVRPMLGREEKLLLMAKESGPTDRDADILQAIKQSVTNCIVSPKNVDVDKFATFDLEYLFIRLREISVATTIKVSYRDGEDEQVYDFEIPLKDIQVKFPEGVNKMIEVNDNVAIRMKYPEAALYNDEEFKKAEGKLMMDLLIKKSIDSVIQDGTTYCFADAPAEEQETFVDELPMKTLENIREFLVNVPKVYYKISYKNSLDHEREIELSTLNDFFTLA